ncbi:hypothetical protein Acsp06_08990 [Actinomycetospora sp. NBRC 106375]|nr:hypothetical protein Acsp06_08990 [Actinomycetospora sp. NBRC 106375]
MVGTTGQAPRRQDTITSPAPEPTLSEHVDRQWLDRLVDLQVLATHGDTAAALHLESWLAHDQEARELWNSIAQVCQQLRPDGGAA